MIEELRMMDPGQVGFTCIALLLGWLCLVHMCSNPGNGWGEDYDE